MAKIYECAHTHTHKQINKGVSLLLFSHLSELVHYKIVVINDQA